MNLVVDGHYDALLTHPSHESQLFSKCIFGFQSNNWLYFLEGKSFSEFFVFCFNKKSFLVEQKIIDRSPTLTKQNFFGKVNKQRETNKHEKCKNIKHDKVNKKSEIDRVKRRQMERKKHEKYKKIEHDSVK